MPSNQQQSVDSLQFPKTALFYTSVQGTITEDIVKELFNFLKKKDIEGEVYQQIIKKERNDGMIYSVLAYKRKIRPSCFDKDIPLESKWYERKFAYLILVEYGDYVVVAKKNIPVFNHLKQFITAIGYNILKEKFSGRGVSFKKLSMKNLELSNSAIRSKSFEAENLESVFSPQGASSFVLNTFNLEKEGEAYSVAINQSKINKLRDKKEGLEIFLEWIKSIVDGLKSEEKVSEEDFLNIFAEPVANQKIKDNEALTPTSILIYSNFLFQSDDITLYEIDENGEHIQLDRDEIMNHLRFCKKLTYDKDYLFVADDHEGIALSVKVLDNSIKLESKWLDSIYIKSDSEDASFDNMSLSDYLNSEGLFNIQFSNFEYHYVYNRLFRDHRMLKSINQFLSIFKTFGELGWTTSEKGTLKQESVTFEDGTLFSFIERNFSESDSILICDDMGTEWADYISISDTTVKFFAAKHRKKTFSASEFQIVIAQVQKNLGVFYPSEEELSAREKKWSKNYVKPKDKNVERQETKITRVRTEGKTAKDACRKWRDLKLNPNYRREVYVVIDFFEKNVLERELGNIRLKNETDHSSEAKQILWLISSFVLACQNLNVEAHILCRP